MPADGGIRSCRPWLYAGWDGMVSRRRKLACTERMRRVWVEFAAIDGGGEAGMMGHDAGEAQRMNLDATKFCAVAVAGECQPRWCAAGIWTEIRRMLRKRNGVAGCD